MRHCANPAALCGYMSTLNNMFYVPCFVFAFRLSLALLIILYGLAAQLNRVYLVLLYGARRPATPRMLVSADFIVRFTLMIFKYININSVQTIMTHSHANARFIAPYQHYSNSIFASRILVGILLCCPLCKSECHIVVSWRGI